MNNVAMAKAYIIQAVERIGHSEEAMRRAVSWLTFIG